MAASCLPSLARIWRENLGVDLPPPRYHHGLGVRVLSAWNIGMAERTPLLRAM